MRRMVVASAGDPWLSLRYGGQSALCAYAYPILALYAPTRSPRMLLYCASTPRQYNPSPASTKSAVPPTQGHLRISYGSLKPAEAEAVAERLTDGLAEL
eukprot:3019933-Rhodomonas_salina.1